MHKNHSHPHMPETVPDYNLGTLPHKAPLAVPFVPFQQPNPPMYSQQDGLTRGAMFPGLDLPFHNQTNTTNPSAGTLLGEVQALEFALVDLGLYLDTHPHDQAVVDMFEFYSRHLQQTKAKYESKFGPLCKENAVQDNQYRWLDDPWPWEYAANKKPGERFRGEAPEWRV